MQSIQKICEKTMILEKGNVKKDKTEKGLPFEEATCECAKVPETIPPGEIPPYLTFPGDDMKVGALAALVGNLM